MASVEKQLLGTETVRAMRSRGVTSVVCGLSANDVKAAFLDAGADAFELKPLPCKQDALAEALKKVWARRRRDPATTFEQHNVAEDGSVGETKQARRPL